MTKVITLSSLERNFTKFMRQVEKQRQTFFVEVNREKAHWVVLRPVHNYEKASFGRILAAKKGRDAKRNNTTNRRKPRRR